MNEIDKLTNRAAARIERLEDDKRRFLLALAESGIAKQAAKAIGVNVTTAYRWRLADADFREAWDSLQDNIGQVVEDALLKRAVEGVEEPIYYAGQKVGTVRRYSDAGAMMLLRGLRPGRHRENAGAINIHTGGGGVAILPGVMNEADWEANALALTQTMNKIANAAAAGDVVEGTCERVEIKRGS